MGRVAFSYLVMPALGNGIVAGLTLLGRNFDQAHLILFYSVVVFSSLVSLVSLMGFLVRDMQLGLSMPGSALQAVLLLTIFAGFYRDLGLYDGADQMMGRTKFIPNSEPLYIFRS